MDDFKKKYWIKYTQKKSYSEKTVVIKWFDFLENRDLVLKTMIQSGNYQDINFGEKTIKSLHWNITRTEDIIPTLNKPQASKKK